MSRSSEAHVRNPMLRLHAMRKLQALPEEQRKLLAMLLREVSFDARERAEKCWRTHKAPMAVYWKAVAVYAGHTARAIHRR